MKIFLLASLILLFVFNSFSSSLSFNFNNYGEFNQIANRDIAGTITDKNNKFIVGLRVKVIDIFTKKQYKTKTNKSGFFIFSDLPLGTYTLKFEGGKAFLPQTVEKIEVGLNGGVIYNTKLIAR